MDRHAQHPLLATATASRARAAVVAAIDAGHRVVLLLSDHAAPAAILLGAAASDLAPLGRAVRFVAARRLGPADLHDADRQVVVVVDAVGDHPDASPLLDEALRRPAGPQLLLSAGPAWRARTAARGLWALHFAPFVVYLPALPDADAARYYTALAGRPAARPLLRAAAGDPVALERLGRHRLARLAATVVASPAALLLDRPAAGLLAAFGLAAAAAAIALHPAANPGAAPAPPGQGRPAPATPPATPPTTRPLTPATANPAGPLVTDDFTDRSGPSPSDTGVSVSRVDPDDLLSPRLVAARPGESLAAVVSRAYRGLVAPPLPAIRALNPGPLRPGVLVICPAPDAGWPATWSVPAPASAPGR